MDAAVARQGLKPADQVRQLPRRVHQTDHVPAHPDDEIHPFAAVLEEAPQGLGAGIPAVADPHLARGGFTPVQGLAATRIGDVQMENPPRARS